MFRLRFSPCSLSRIVIFRPFAWLACLALVGAAFTGSAFCADPESVEKVELGGVRVVYKCGNLWMASQPSEADLKLMSDLGVTCVVTLRTDEEVSWDEKGVTESLGMEFRKIPFASIESLTDEVFASARKLLAEKKNKPLFLHCGAAVRVAAVWAAYRVLDEGVPLEEALREAEPVGLRSSALKARVVEYIQSQQ